MPEDNPDAVRIAARAHPGLLVIKRGLSKTTGKLMTETSVDEVRNAGRQLIAFAPEIASTETAIKAFLWDHMYRHERVMRIMRAG